MLLKFEIFSKWGVWCYMVKKIDILGINLDNYTVREAMLQMDVCWNNTIMSTVETISMETLVKAQSDELVKKCIESLDLAIICDKEILKVAGIMSSQRLKETKENEFLKEFLRRTARNKRTVYLLGDSKERIGMLQEFLNENYEKIKIAGVYALDECGGDYDAVINEINIATPDVILSVLSTPNREYFLIEHKEKLNAKIWYGLGEDYAGGQGKSEVADFARKLIQKGIMHTLLLRYKKSDSEEGNE